MIVICAYNDKQIPYDLLLEADPEKKNVDNYLLNGILFGAYDNGLLVGVYILVKKEEYTFEIVNLSVKKTYQNQGIGKLLICHAENQAKISGGKYIEIGTSYNLVKYYEKQGYKYYKTIKNFFIDNYSQPVIDNGIILKDMEVLKKNLI